MEFELTPEQIRIFEMINETSNSSRIRFKSALHHIQKAWKIRTTDLEMAAFRGITAEEEAASGLLMALVNRKYENVDLLKPRYHPQKMAVFPFLLLLQKEAKSFDDTTNFHHSLVLGNSQDPYRIKLRISFPTNSDLTLDFFPEPPLNFYDTIDGERVPLHHLLAYQIEQLKSEQSVKAIMDYIRKRVDERNKILYTSDVKIPSITRLSDAFFMHKMQVITIIGVAYLLIEQYKEIQPFAQEALNAFLYMLNKLPKDE